MPLRDFSSVPLVHTPSLSISLFNFYDEELEQRLVWRSRIFSQRRPYSAFGKIARFAPWHLTIPYDVYVIIKRKHLDTPLEENSSVENTTFHFLHIALTTSLKFLQLALKNCLFFLFLIKLSIHMARCKLCITANTIRSNCIGIKI